MSGEGTLEQVLAGDARWCVVHGDCRDLMLRRLPAKRVFDVCIADPPYSAWVHSRSIRRTYLPDVADQPCRKTRAHDFGFEHLTEVMQREMAIGLAGLVKRWTLVFSDTESAHSWKDALTDNKLDFVRYGFWVKDRAMPQISGDRPGSRVEQITIVHPRGKKRWNGGGLGNVWQHPVVVNCNGHRSDRIHTAQKPESLLLELVELFSDRGEVVFDPTSGSATTGVACLKLGRRFIGCELNAEWAELSRERLRAEESNSTLAARRAGQATLFGGTG